MRSAAALALLAFLFAGCTRERPSFYSVRSCLERELPTFQVAEVPIDESYTGVPEDLTGARGVGAIDYRNKQFLGAAIVVLARSDPDAKRIQHSRLGRVYFGSNRRGSVLWSTFGARRLRQHVERCV